MTRALTWPVIPCSPASSSASVPTAPRESTVPDTTTCQRPGSSGSASEAAAEGEHAAAHDDGRQPDRGRAPGADPQRIGVGEL
jgi:hypothetical protein